MTLNLAEFVKVMAGENPTVTVDGQYMTAALRRAELLEELATVERWIKEHRMDVTNGLAFEKACDRSREILAELAKGES